MVDPSILQELACVTQLDHELYDYLPLMRNLDYNIQIDEANWLTYNFCRKVESTNVFATLNENVPLTGEGLHSDKLDHIENHLRLSYNSNYTC